MAQYKIRAPALPIQPNEYDRSQMDQFQNALRLYFNRLDDYNVINSVPPSGTTANRPVAELQVGQFYFDTTLNTAIYWDGTNWVTSGGGGSGTVTSVGGTGTVSGLSLSGTVTTSGFTRVIGDSFTTTNGHEFLLQITTTTDGSTTFSLLNVIAMQ
jgi:hypothetical protein